MIASTTAPALLAISHRSHPARPRVHAEAGLADCRIWPGATGMRCFRGTGGPIRRAALPIVFAAMNWVALPRGRKRRSISKRAAWGATPP